MRFKRITAVILSMIIALGLFTPAFAAVTCSFDETTGTLTINGSGAVTEADVSAAVNNDKSLIKKVAFGIGITSIGDYAFKGCSGLTEISLPSGLVSIGNNAFKGCSGLTEISLPSGLDSIGSSAFYDCVSLESINIPSGVTLIANDTFSGCTKLESVIMPGVERIGDRAFYGCSSIVSLDLPSGLESIGSFAFYNCSSLKNIAIYPGISVDAGFYNENEYAIGDNAFASCSNLKSLFLPYFASVDFGFEQRRFCPASTFMLGYTVSGTVADIVSAAGNTAAKSIIIPEKILSWNVRSVSAGVFTSYYRIKTAFVPDISFEEAFNPSTTLFINGGESVSGNLGISEVTIPADISSIADGAFTAFEFLREIGVEDGNPAFISLNHVLYAKDSDGKPKFLICYPQNKTTSNEYTIPDGVTGIKPFAFYGCDILKKLTIPAGVESVGVSAFEKCTALKEIIVDENNPHFISINGVLFTKDSVGRPEELVFYPHDTEEESYVIPDGVRSIGASAFYASRLKEITIPDSVTSIGASAFKDSRVKQITIPDSVTNIGESAFEGLMNVIYGENMTASGSPWGAEYFNKYYEAPFVYENEQKQTLIYCEPDTVKSVIPVSVNNVVFSAFDDCDALSYVFMPAGFTNGFTGSGTGTDDPGTGPGASDPSHGPGSSDPGMGPLDPLDPDAGTSGPVYGIRFAEGANIFKYSITAGAESSTDGLIHIAVSARYRGDNNYIFCDATGEGYRIDSAEITGVELFHAPGCPDYSDFEIDSYDRLKEFAGKVNSGNIYLNAALTADIDASSSATAGDWVPVGSPDYPYSAVFDGGGHKITGLNLNNPGSDYAGLFGYVGKSGIIRNAGLEGGSIAGKDYAGGIAGFNCGVVSECYNTSAVTGNDRIGGLAGHNSGKITHCRNEGDTTGNNCVGGIAGSIEGAEYVDAESELIVSMIEYCSNSGNVTGSYGVGGLLGYSYVNDCYFAVAISYNTGSVYGDSFVGGVCGKNRTQRSVIIGCYNTGDVAGSSYTGGVFGDVGGGYYWNCLSMGRIKIIIKSEDGSVNVYNPDEVNEKDHIGGVAGSGNSMYYCYYDINKAPGLTAVGSDKNISAENTAGLTTGQMTGANASDNIMEISLCGHGIYYGGYLIYKANDDGFAYYPHLKGFNLDEDGNQLPADEIAAEDWPAKTALANYEAGAHSLTLDGDIGVNFYMDIPDLTHGAYAVFTVDGVTSEVPADPESYIMSGDTKLYKFTCNVAAAQTDTVITGYINNGGLPSVEFTYSVQEYLTELMNDPQYNDDEKMMTLAASLAAYGLYANELFGYNPDFARHALADDSGFESVTAASLSDFAPQISDTAEGVTYIGSSLLLRTKTGIRHYFSLPEGKTVDDFTFLLGEGDDAVTLTPAANGGNLYVEITDIPSAELGDSLTVTVRSVSGGLNAVNTWTYSALSYVYNVLTKAENGEPEITAKLVNVCKALTLYCCAAKEYFIGQEITFLLTDNLNWQEGYVYARDSTGKALTGEYPGTRAETTVNEYGETVFIVRLPAKASGCIISDGHSYRTVEITDFSYTGYWMDGSTDNDGNFRVIGWN